MKTHPVRVALIRADRLTCQRSQWFCERGQLCGACTAAGTAGVTVQCCVRWLERGRV